MGLYKNVASQKIAVYAHDTANDVPKTGDAANITAQLSKDFGAAAATNDTNPTELDATDHPGIYVFDLTQSETNADNIVISAVSSTADILLDPIQVFTVPPNFRALAIESDGMAHADLKEMLGDAQSLTDLKDFADDGYDPSTNKVQGVVTTDTATAVTTVNGLANNVITAASIASDAIAASKIADGALTAAKFAAGAFDAVWSVATRLLTAGTNIVLAKGTGVTGFNDLDAAGVRSAVGLASANLDTQIDALPTAAENADAIWDEATAGHTTAGTYGKAVSDVLADTNELQVDWVNGGRLDLLLDSAVSNSGTLLTDWQDGGRLDLLLDATLADTNELQQDWVNGGRLDNILDARASQASVNTIDDLLDNEIGDLTTAVAALSSALAVVDGNVDAILLDTGTDGVPLTAAAVDAIHDEPITEPVARPAWSSMTHRKIQQTLGVLMLNELDSDGNSVDVRNDADDATLWSYPSSDDGSTYISGKAA